MVAWTSSAGLLKDKNSESDRTHKAEHYRVLTFTGISSKFQNDTDVANSMAESMKTQAIYMVLVCFGRFDYLVMTAFLKRTE